MQLFKRIRLEDMLFLDIEAVRCQKEYPQGDLKDSWEYKMRNEPPEVSRIEQWEQKGSLYAEFNKIVCVSLGRVKDKELTIKSYYGDDEKDILRGLDSDLRVFSKKPMTLVGHSIKGFDIPVLMRRSIVGRIPLNPYFDLAHLKPWETTFLLDIAEAWKATGFYPASLINIAVALGIQHSKTNIDGSEVSEVYYEGRLGEIKDYCEQDIRVAYEITKVLQNS